MVLRGNLAPDGAVIKQTAASPSCCSIADGVCLRDVEQMLARSTATILPVNRDTVLVMRMRAEGRAGISGMGADPDAESCSSRA